jgi:hypothetical protein
MISTSNTYIPGYFTEDRHDFGVRGEEQTYPFLLEEFGKDLIKRTARARTDFYNSQYEIELKSRRGLYREYTSALITKDKGFDTDKNLIFYFTWDDARAFIVYNKEQFKNYSVKIVDRKPNWCIPYSHLTWTYKEPSRCLL